jgi:TonB family protein
MKTILAILIFSLFLAGCENKSSKVEVVPNLESIYTSVNDVDTPPQETEATNKIMTNSLVEAVKSLYDKNSGEPERFIIALRIYGNEHGTIDKIKDISKPLEEIHSGVDTVKDYTNNNKLVAAIAQRMDDWKFEPAKINGKPVKCWSDIKLNILMKPDGTYSIELPDFLTDMSFFSSKDNYLVLVDKMPELIGGIKGLQEKIHYPEIARRAGIEGKVYILTYIDENGNITKALVIKGIGGGCDEAALNAVKESKFIPGEQKGKRVKVQVTVPVLFKLSK